MLLLSRLKSFFIVVPLFIYLGGFASTLLEMSDKLTYFLAVGFALGAMHSWYYPYKAAFTLTGLALIIWFIVWAAYAEDVHKATLYAGMSLIFMELVLIFMPNLFFSRPTED